MEGRREGNGWIIKRGCYVEWVEGDKVHLTRESAETRIDRLRKEQLQ